MHLYLRVYIKPKAIMRYVKRTFLILYRTHRLGCNIKNIPLSMILLYKHLLRGILRKKMIIITIIIEHVLFAYTYIQYG